MRRTSNTRGDAEPVVSQARAWRIAFLVLCTVGGCLSGDLIRLHVNVHTDPNYRAFCAISEKVNCETVAASPHAVFLGLPVAVWGLLGYVAMGALTVWGLRSRLRAPTWPFGMLFWLNVFAVVVSAFLFYVSHFVIDSICIVCAGTYLVNVSLLAVAGFELRRAGTGPWRALAAEARSVAAAPRAFAALAGTLAVAVALLWATVPPYWRVELPTLSGGMPVGFTPDGHPWIGARKPVIEIVEFSDYQCPHCRRGHDEMRELVRAHPDEVRVIHRHFPLDHHCNPIVEKPFHPWACDYSRLAFCAGEQGRFWDANDLLFVEGRRGQEVAPEEMARVLKLNAAALAECARSERASRFVEADLNAGRALGIRGTPTFVLAGRTFPGRIPPEVVSAALSGKKIP